MLPGYAWIFPIGDGEFNVGCGLFDRERRAPAKGRGRAAANLRAIFARFTRDFPIARDLMARATSVTPLAGARLRCGLEGTSACGPGPVVAIGETIGATFPFTGEGIGKAMETGELAAEAVHDWLTGRDARALDEFPRRLASLAPRYTGYRIAERWLSRAWLTDFLARRVNASRFLHAAAAGILNETMDPRELFSVRGVVRSFVR